MGSDTSTGERSRVNNEIGKVKAAGKLVRKGKDAEILDGDVIHFLFKV